MCSFNNVNWKCMFIIVLSVASVYFLRNKEILPASPFWSQTYFFPGSVALSHLLFCSECIVSVSTVSFRYQPSSHQNEKQYKFHLMACTATLIFFWVLCNDWLDIFSDLFVEFSFFFLLSVSLIHSKWLYSTQETENTRQKCDFVVFSKCLINAWLSSHLKCYSVYSRGGRF